MGQGFGICWATHMNAHYLIRTPFNFASLSQVICFWI